jgi:hypothetical protein
VRSLTALQTTLLDPAVCLTSIWMWLLTGEQGM